MLGFAVVSRCKQLSGYGGRQGLRVVCWCSMVVCRVSNQSSAVFGLFVSIQLPVVEGRRASIRISDLVSTAVFFLGLVGTLPAYLCLSEVSPEAGGTLRTLFCSYPDRVVEEKRDLGSDPKIGVPQKDRRKVSL